MNAGSVGMVGLMAANPSLPSEDGGSKKIRKPYTITKSRESWTEQEHDKFLEALQLFDRDWKKIEAFVGSKTVIQIRSHAQKYFLKVQKNGTGEHVPPPRPKRKSAQPYPQKAAKAAPPGQTNARVLPVPHTAAEYGYVIAPQQCNVYVPAVSATVSPWVHHAVPPGTIPYGFKDANQPELATLPSGMKNQSHSSSTGSTWSQSAPAQPSSERVHPAFPEVYQFIGSVFDPEVTGHLKKLREMAPIDKETVLLLMRNLAINLASPDFDERKLFANSTDDKSNAKADCSDVQVPFRSNETVTETSPANTKGNTTSTRFCDRPRQVICIPADVSKHQRHPYDGGGLGVQAEQIKDELDYISEVLEGASDIELAYDSQQQQLGVPASSGTPEEDSYELGLESHAQHHRQLSAPVNSKAGEEEESVDRWWRP